MDRNFFASPYRLDQPGEREAKSQKELTWQPEYEKWRYTYNIANDAAVDFYKMHGLENIHLHSNWVLTNARMNRSSCNAAIASAIP